MRPIVTDGVAWCVGRSVGLSVCLAGTIASKSSAVAEMGDCLATIDIGLGQKLGTLFEGRESWAPFNTMSLGRGLPPYQVAPGSTQPFGHNRYAPKIGGCAPFRGELGPHLTQCRLGHGLPLYKWHLDPSSCLATIHGPEIGEGCCPPFWRGELGPRLTQCRLGRGLPPYKVAS